MAYGQNIPSCDPLSGQGMNCELPFNSGQGGSLLTVTQKTHFPKEFLIKLDTYQDYS